jgi:hypothetical protein
MKGALLAFQVADDGYLRLDHAAQRDDIAPHQRDLLHDLAHVLVEHVLFNGANLAVHFAQHGKVVVHHRVQDHVQQPPCAAPHLLAPRHAIVLAGGEEGVQSLETPIVDGDQKTCPDEEVHLAGARHLARLVVDRKVHDDKEIVVILVDLRPLNLTENVLQIQGMKGIVLAQIGHILGCGILDVYPGQALMGDRGDAHRGLSLRS